MEKNERVSSYEKKFFKYRKNKPIRSANISIVSSYPEVYEPTKVYKLYQKTFNFNTCDKG